ncbi:YcxB family protein [Streptomyces sp. NPDC003435]
MRHLPRAQDLAAGAALSPRVRRSRDRAARKAVVGAAVTVGLVVLQGRYDDPTHLVYLTGCISGALTGRSLRTVLLSTPWGRRWSARHAVDARSDPEVTVGDDGIVLVADGRSLEPWDTFTGHIETERQFILLRASGEPAVTLPKRTFPDAALVAECRRLLAERLPARYEEK